MKTYTFSVNNQEYILKYNFNSICELEDKAGAGINSLFSQDKAGLNMIRLVIWAGLKWKDPGITPQRVGFMLQQFIDEDGDFNTLAQECIKLLGESISNEKMREHNTGE